MRFNNRFFFALLTFFITFFADKNGAYGLPLPRPAAKVEGSLPKPIAARSTDPDDREEHMLALRNYMENVQLLGGSPYGRSLLKRNIPVATADKVAMPTQLKASSSGFIFLPVVGASQASSSSSGGQEKVGAAPTRQTMFINIEAPSGGQVAQIDIPGVKGDAKKDDPCPDDQNKDAGAKAKADDSKASDGAAGQDNSAPGPDANQAGPGCNQSQGEPPAAQDKTPAGGASQDNSKALKSDDAKLPPPDDANGSGNAVNNGAVSLAAVPIPSGTPSVTPTPKTTLQAPAGIDESKKTRVVFKPLSDPDPLTPPPTSDSKVVNPPVQTSPVQQAPPAVPTPDLSNTGAVPDNADDKKPDPKGGAAGGVQSGLAATNSQQDTTLQGNGNPASVPNAVQISTTTTTDPASKTLDLGIAPTASPANTNATAASTPNPPASIPPITTGNLAAGNNKDYFIYPVEQDDKLVDLKKGDMVAYVDKSGNLSNDGSSQAVKQMLNGGGIPPVNQPAANVPPASTTLPPVKRTHPRMWDMERRALPEKLLIPKRKRAEKNEKDNGFKLRPGIKAGSIAYYGQPVRRSFRP